MYTEHVGKNNQTAYFDTVHRCLKEDGISLLHTIGYSHSMMPSTDPWGLTYIFPNSYLPYYKEIADRVEDRFIIEDWQNFGKTKSIFITIF